MTGKTKSPMIMLVQDFKTILRSKKNKKIKKSTYNTSNAVNATKGFLTFSACIEMEH